MKKLTYEKRAYQFIKDQILQGNYHVGEHIPEAKIATQLGISRTPVRHALKILEKEQLVEIQSHKGAVVVPSDMTVDRYLDLIEFSEGLMLKTIEKFKRKNGSFPIEEMTQIMQYMQDAIKEQDEEKFISQLFKYFFTLIRLMQNQYAAEWVLSVEQEFDRKARKELRSIPVSLAEETIHYLETINHALINKNYQLAEETVEMLINRYIIRTFRY
ncbi:GntR family transcriptional regulator [Listeria costaricensis]|uniref:GntR family transcriptional regulator n=1 Tax=Listeria costaricensis TaxID=2026604 RepID=UPI000C07F2CD|nr:GntR family transcriptional regulator [Listeria costaricensis]